VTAVKIRSTNWLPVVLLVLSDLRRHSTALRSGRSAALLVGSTPGTFTNDQSAASTFRMLRQVRSVFSCPASVPARNNTPDTPLRRFDRDFELTSCQFPAPRLMPEREHLSDFAQELAPNRL